MHDDTQHSDEITELRDKVATLEVEMQRLQAERDTAIATADGHQPDRGRRDPGDSSEIPRADAVSRRRLLGLLGGAAAAGAGLAVAGSTVGADRANAADGDPVTIGATNISNNGSGTGLQGQTFSSTQIFGATNLGTGPGLAGFSTNGNSIVAVAPGNNTPGAHLLLSAGGMSGPPTANAHTLGQFWLDSAGVLWQCVAAGTPGRWVRQSPLVPVNPPARVLDSRNTGGPISNGQTRAVTVTGTFGASTIPTGISAVLTNLTAAEGSGSGFLAMFQHGTTWSGTSNLNVTNGQTIANNATSPVSAGNPGQVDVRCGGPLTTQFIVDVFGYYP
jgi:hypothetical protein